MTQVVDSGAGATFDIAVRWGDLDAMNHVNNTVYFRYIEEARVHAENLDRAAGKR